MQTPVDDSGIFTEVSRSLRFPLVFDVDPRKLAPGLPHALVSLRDGLSQTAPRHLHYRAFA